MGAGVLWYYVETIGNITDEAVQKYIKELTEESKKRISAVPLYSGPVKVLATLPCGTSSNIVL